MTTIEYIGFDIHKKTISFCAKAQDGTILEEGTIPALRNKLLAWAQALKVAHPAMLKALTAAKKKNDKVDARTIADLLRCNLLPECHMAPCAIHDLRRVLRYRNLVTA